MTWNDAWLYLALNAFTLSYPLAQSFEWRLKYWKKWYAVMPAILITGAIFIAWDITFTEMGIWGFNERYLSGISLAGLPLGEWLFFLTVPYACIFIYEVLRFYVKRDVLGRIAPYIGGTVLLLTGSLILFYYDHWYTCSASAYLFVVMGINLFVLKSKWLGRFFLAYIVILIPFLLVNGVLTGTGIEGEVVWYNDTENLGIRLLTIPVDDLIYNMGLILSVVTLTELFLDRASIGDGIRPQKAAGKKVMVGA